jgi:uncharacterized protein YkwD
MRFLALLLLLVQMPALAADTASEITPSNIVAVMNEYRAERGLPPLHEEQRLELAAQDRVKHMEDLGYWAHQAPDGMSPFVWLAAHDYPYSVAAENLAAGFETVGVLVQSWMESPGHRANILTPEFSDCGIAVIEGSTTGPATGKSIVVLFARPQEQAVAIRQP